MARWPTKTAFEGKCPSPSGSLQGEPCASERNSVVVLPCWPEVNDDLSSVVPRARRHVPHSIHGRVSAWGRTSQFARPRITKQVLRETKSRPVGPQRRSPAVQFEVDPHGRGRLTLAHVDADAYEIPHAVGVGGRRPPHGYQRGAIVVAGLVRAHVDRPRIVDWASHGEWAHVENTASRARAEARDAASEAPISRRRLDRRKPRGGARGGADSPVPNSTPGRDRSSASGLDSG